MVELQEANNQPELLIDQVHDPAQVQPIFSNSEVHNEVTEQIEDLNFETLLRKFPFSHKIEINA